MAKLTTRDQKGGQVGDTWVDASTGFGYRIQTVHSDGVYGFEPAEVRGGVAVRRAEFNGLAISNDGEANLILSGVNYVTGAFLMLTTSEGYESPVPFPSGSSRTRWYVWDWQVFVESDWSADGDHTLSGWVEYVES